VTSSLVITLISSLFLAASIFGLVRADRSSIVAAVVVSGAVLLASFPISYVLVVAPNLPIWIFEAVTGAVSIGVMVVLYALAKSDASRVPYK